MNKLTNRLAAVGALLLMNGAVALAQSEMKFEVPFAFETPHAQMPAGKYFVTELNGLRAAPFYRVQHAETGKAVVLVAPITVTRKNSARELKPQVAFHCAAEQCALAEIYGVGTTYGHAIPVKLKKTATTASLQTVTIAGTAE